MLKVKTGERFDPSWDPSYAHPGDGGLPLYIPEDVVLTAWIPRVIAHEQAYEMERGVHAFVMTRSSSHPGRRLVVDTGLVDNNYRGKVSTSVTYRPDLLTCFKAAFKAFLVLADRKEGETIRHTFKRLKAIVPRCTLKRGERISQMVLLPVITEKDLNQVDTLSSTVRGAGGFGTTGL